MPNLDMDEYLRDLYVEVDVAEAQEGEPEVGEVLRNVREHVAEFLDNVEEDADDLRDVLVSRLLEAENSLQERYPKLSERFRLIVNFLSDSGV